MSLRTKKLSINHWWDVWIALFILTVIIMVAARLWVTDWTEDLYILVCLMFFAGISGLALGVSQFSPFLSTLFSLVYGIFTIGWLFGTTVEVNMTWRNRILYDLAWRLRTAIAQFAAGEAVSDPILFLTIMAIVLWILGSTTAFMLIREGVVWPSLIPLGFTLMIISHFDQNLARNTRFLMTFLFLTLLIVGRMTFLRYQQQWQREGIHTTSEINIDFAKTLFILASVLMILARLIPITPNQVTHYSELWNTVTEPWDRLSERLSDLFNFEGTSSSLSTGYFSDSISLGTGSPTSEKMVFTVKVESDPPAGYRNYWRARSYDTYQDADWSSSLVISEKLLFPDSFNIPFPNWAGEQSASYTFTIETNNILNLYTTGAPTWVSHPVNATTHLISNSTVDLIAMIAEPALAKGEQYQVNTQVSLPTIAQLRQTGSDYPDWVLRYLQLPSNFSVEIKNLAAEIAAGMIHPYDQALALTQYLRENINYTQTISPPPASSDPIEWFLFEEKEGFCNYYATAEVLMLRSLGIPARLAVGYAAGDYDRQANTYTVHKRDSHAWPEVYFVDYGWVFFEPTTSQPEMTLPLGAETNIGDEGLLPDDWEIPLTDVPDEISDTLPETPPESIENDPIIDAESAAEASTPPVVGKSIVWGIVIALSSCLILVLFFLFRRKINLNIHIKPLPTLLEGWWEQNGGSPPNWLKRWSYRAQMSTAERAYLQIGRSIKVMGRAITPAKTPAERAQILAALIPNAKDPIADIINEYQLDAFSNHLINEERARDAARQVRRLALRVRFRQVFGFGKKSN